MGTFAGQTSGTLTARINDQPDFTADNFTLSKGPRWEIKATHVAPTGNPADHRELKFYVPACSSDVSFEITYPLHISNAENKAMATFCTPPSIALSREGTLTLQYCASEGTMTGSFSFMCVSAPCNERYQVTEGHFKCDVSK
ncbi:hypothetical protein [Pseudomonas fitomaticsae]|uniref:Uncharacterized protein n=1 Tax=Pseudomonas fitomaticsae TaxID=2837969 RepID=A0ABY3Q8D6_9PSED|nr:hypothetical protein [Pseudomonas fitomaticsae]UFQ02413.1 hypothetical protein KJY40_12220 [Pseudomonas fitomaticsae]